MFALFRGTADMGDRTRDAMSGVPAERRDDRCFTDGVNLYRIVEALGNSSGNAVIGLEDCRSFEVVLMTAEEFPGLRLRPVRAAHSV